MANNRMLIVHKATGRAVIIAKYYPNNGWAATKADLEKFMDEFVPADFEKGDDFVLAYESGADFQYVSRAPLKVQI
jgi:hypothetical protein